MSDLSQESPGPPASAGRLRAVAHSHGGLGILVVLVIGSAIRLNYVLLVLISGVKLSGDALYRYHAIAQNLVSGNGFSSDLAPPFHANTFEQPIYPSFVEAIYWLTSGSQKAVVVVQLGVELLTLLLVLQILRGASNLLSRQRAGSFSSNSTAHGAMPGHVTAAYQYSSVVRIPGLSVEAR
jgi:hypothetical protein